MFIPSLYNFINMNIRRFGDSLYWFCYWWVKYANAKGQVAQIIVFTGPVFQNHEVCRCTNVASRKLHNNHCRVSIHYELYRALQQGGLQFQHGGRFFEEQKRLHIGATSWMAL